MNVDIEGHAIELVPISNLPDIDLEIESELCCLEVQEMILGTHMRDPILYKNKNIIQQQPPWGEGHGGKGERLGRHGVPAVVGEGATRRSP